MLKNIVKKTLTEILTTKMAQWTLADYQRRHQLIPILNLHKISPEANPFWPAIHPSLFEELLSELNKNYRFVGVGEINHIEDWTRPVMALSFDDGYRDFIDHALPIMKKYNIRANQNIIVSSVDSGTPPWTVLMYDYLAQASESELKDIPIPGFDYTYSNDKPRLGLELSRFLKNRSIADRNELTYEFWPRVLNTPMNKRTKMMSLNEVRQLKSDCDLGAHSCDHESMQYEDMDYFKNDFQNCQIYFQKSLNTNMHFYAFPNGGYTEEHLIFLKSYPETKALLVKNRLAQPGRTAYPRLSIYGQNLKELHFRSLGYSQWGLA